MPYLVDGSNLGGRIGGARGARDRAAVLEVLLGWMRPARGAGASPTRAPRRRVIVVFDGPADGALASAYGPLEVRFAGKRSADEVILGLLAEPASDWWVVSADRALVAACRDRGAHTLSVEEVLAGSGRRAGLDEPPASARTAARAADAVTRAGDAPVDVEDWEAWFRHGGNDGDR